MTAPTAALGHLLSLPLSERHEALLSLVSAEFRRVLLLEDDEELPLDRNYFDLGLTSLRLTEIKRRLETELECEISANTVFNQPTIGQLVDHLAEDVLTEVFAADDTVAPVAAPTAQGGAAEEDALLDAALKDLYEG